LVDVFGKLKSCSFNTILITLNVFPKSTHILLIINTLQPNLIANYQQDGQLFSSKL